MQYGGPREEDKAGLKVDDKFRALEKKIRAFAKDHFIFTNRKKRKHLDATRQSPVQRPNREVDCASADATATSSSFSAASASISSTATASAADSNLPFSWGRLIDIRNPSNRADLAVRELPISDSAKQLFASSSNVSCYTVDGLPEGFIIVRNALTVEQQFHWARKALEEYSNAEHTNLSNLCRLQHSTEGAKECGKPKFELADIENLWQKSADVEGFGQFKTLRWSCLGYHYDWTARTYKKNLKSTMPEDFAALCSNIAQLVGKDLVPEASIINYYPLGTVMGGHIDDAEHTMEKPIVSISIGCPAIFLLGGRVKSFEPFPILLQSGDAVVMSGESRYSYHGIPSIIPHDYSRLVHEHDASGQRRPDLFSLYDSLQGSERHVLDYLLQGRINMNVRQVKVNVTDDDTWVDKVGTGARCSSNSSSGSTASEVAEPPSICEHEAISSAIVEAL